MVIHSDRAAMTMATLLAHGQYSMMKFVIGIRSMKQTQAASQKQSSNSEIIKQNNQHTSTKETTTMDTSTLTHLYEQKGTLIYIKPDFTYATVRGWFYTYNGYVVMRKLRGRNCFRLCSEESIYQFTQDK